MPELPEVETIKNDLAEHVISQTIISVVFPPDSGNRILRRSVSPPVFVQEVEHSFIGNLRRRAKYLIFDLQPEKMVVMHLGMSGQILLRPSGAAPEPYVRAVFHLSNGREIRFSDPRRFGEILLQSPSFKGFSIDFEKLGPEPLENSFTVPVFTQALVRSRRAIKTLLMDQRAIAGLGNIYSDESLFRAGIHPERRACSLAGTEIQELHRAIRTVLRKAVKNRGTTALDKRYQDGHGRSGNFQKHLNVYQRKGNPCPRCGALIQSMVLGGRTASFCSNCQK